MLDLHYAVYIGRSTDMNRVRSHLWRINMVAVAMCACQFAV
jgi:hypothetical protein